MQLLLVQLKHNQLIVAIWVLLTGIILKWFMLKYGAYNLFLHPEYMGKVNFVSHLILGFSLGGFIVAYHVSTYILNGRRFPFLASLSKPFGRYVLNNFIIPGSYVVILLIQLVYHQLYEQLIPLSQMLINLTGLLLGMGVFFFASMLYFTKTNMNVSHVEVPKRRRYRPIQTLLSKREKWYLPLPGMTQTVHTFITYPFRIKHTRDTAHYDKKTLQFIFMQNHVNATMFDIVVILSIMFFSFMVDSPRFILPAAANFVLMFTMILLFIGAIYSWFRFWSIFVLLFLLLGYNQLTKSTSLNFVNYAYGLSYEKSVPYSNEVIRGLAEDTAVINRDTREELEVLENWKRLQEAGDKPKLIVLNVSGGGSRAAMWTLLAFQKLDSTLGGNLMKRAHIITGASGGMIGAALYRELYARSLHDPSVDPNDPKHLDDIGKDLFNAVALNFALNDWLLHLRQFEYAGHSYPVDRGYAFEKQLSANTNGVLDKKLFDYRIPERECLVPTMVFTPTIANDGRQLIITARPASYLACRVDIDAKNKPALNDVVVFSHLFNRIDHDSLSYLSVLRMNATFFYILPNVSLPTVPRTEVIDAGFRDNLGMVTTLSYLDYFSGWIKENTSGVIVVRIVDHDIETRVQDQPDRSFIESLKGPVAGMYNNFLNIQDFNHDLELAKLNKLLDNKLYVIDLQIKDLQKKGIALSWHLTGREKKLITEAINAPENETSLQVLKLLMSKK